MSARKPFAKNVEMEVESLLAKEPVEGWHLLHYFWTLNAYARYQWFVRHDGKKAMDFVLRAVPISGRFFQLRFDRFESEIRCLIVLMALNVARLSGYSGHYELSKAQFQCLIDFGLNFDLNRLQVFPPVLQKEFRKHLPELKVCLASGNKQFFEQRVASALQNLEKTCSQTKLVSLLDALKENSRATPGKSAFIDFDRRRAWSWKEMDDLSEVLALQLARKEKGTAIICTQQNVLFPALLFACWKAGVLPVLIHEDYTEFEFAYLKEVLNDPDPTLIVDETLSSRTREKFRAWSVNYDEASIEDSCATTESVRIRVNDLALGLLTSGTSDKPKLIVFRHSDLLAAAQIERANEPVMADGIIANLRPHFTSGGVNTLWPALLTGAAHLYSEKIRKRPVFRFVRALLAEHDAGLVVMSPSYIQSMLASGDGQTLSQRPKRLYFGGMSLPKQSIEALMRLGFQPFMRYGMTEVGHIISRLDVSVEDPARAPNSVGIAFGNFEVGMKDGRIAVRSPGVASSQMVKGEFVDLLREGWLVTGDGGQVRPDGEILLVGREHSILCVNGFRFHSQQVEQALLAHVAVKECRVLGVPSAVLGQEVVAFCIPRNVPIAISEMEDLQDFCGKMLSPFKRPKKIIFVTEWPVMANGKIDWSQLKALAQEKDQGVT